MGKSLSMRLARNPERLVWSMNALGIRNVQGRDVLARIERGLSPKASADWPLMRDTISVNNDRAAYLHGKCSSGHLSWVMIQVYTLWLPLLVLRFSPCFGRNMNCCLRNEFDLVALEHDAVGSLYLSWILFCLALEDLPVVFAWKILHVCLRTWLTALYCFSTSLVLIRVKSAKCLGVISLLETEDSIVLRFPCCLCTGSLLE